MLQKMGSLRDFKRKVSPPQPTFMTDEQQSDYLKDLRNNRPARPAGSRPSPFKASTYSSPLKEDTPLRVTSGASALSPANNRTGHLPYERAKSPAPSVTSTRSRPGMGRPLATEPAITTTYSIRGRKVSPNAVIQAPIVDKQAPYQESGSRWMERQEAHALREALKAMDDQDEDTRIHKAAQDEAADLVWHHRNPIAADAEKTLPYRNPDPARRNRFTAHLQKGAHARSQSLTDSVSTRGIPNSDSYRSMSGSSTYSRATDEEVDESNARRLSGGTVHLSQPNKNGEALVSDGTKSSSILGRRSRRISSERRRSSGARMVSSGSGTGVFRNPEDQIFEEPEEASPRITTEHAGLKSERALRERIRNSLGPRPLPERATTTPEGKTINSFEAHRNPPSQSHMPDCATSPLVPLPIIEVIPEVDTPPTKDGIEIRSDDIRAATSKRFSDRSTKLPSPTAVSDRPGRPIVSFDTRWLPKNDSPKIDQEVERSPVRPKPKVPAMAVSAPIIPTINLPEDEVPPVPTINLPEKEEPAVPVISFPESEDAPSTPASGPEAVTASETQTTAWTRPLPRPSKTSPPKLWPTKTASSLPWLNPSSRAGVPTATCANCALPISGRIVTASGSLGSNLKAMLHPECFTCHHCSTGLECVAFYPEPHAKRQERLTSEGIDPESDIDQCFFCHLDFHEFYSPRCKSCKTPIEGEVIIAAGAEWHVGHFFCGECGDPFEKDTPFVEKAGYAYCVRCHTKRTSARCKGCKGLVEDGVTVEALGGRWHEACFCCEECRGGFGEEGRFFVREVEVEGTEKEKRRGISRKMEERAVCQGCEERRLKA